MGRYHKRVTLIGIVVVFLGILITYFGTDWYASDIVYVNPIGVVLFIGGAILIGLGFKSYKLEGGPF